MTRWNELEIEGFEVEDVESPRSAPGPCPACGKSVRLIERELVRNLKVFGVSLVAVERGGKVFQCSACQACFEPPETLPEEAPAPPSRASVEGERAYLQRKLKEASDEATLWRERMTLAEHRKDETLAREAKGLVTRYAAIVETLRDELATLDGSPVGQATKVSDEAVDDDLAALKKKAAERPVVAPATPAAGASDEAAPSRPPTPKPSRDDELEALRRRLGLAPAAAAPPAAETLPETPAPTAPVAAPTPPAPGEADDEMAALKRKLRGK